MNLKEAIEGKEYTILDLQTDDEELNDFLFSLGCYIGETVTVITKQKKGCIVAIKNSRYHIDRQLAEAIQI